MNKVVKLYPARSNLQLYRYDSNAPFECWRCRKTKVSKLQAVVSLEKPRVICNACYGRLLSLAEIKAQDVEPWLKAEQIHDLTLKEISAKEAAEAIEREERRRKQYWKFLSEDARRFIGTAEYLYERMADRSDLDFSPAIIELVKSFEAECISKFVEPLKAQAAREPLPENDVRIECQDKDFGRLAKYVLGREVRPSELGVIAHALVTLINSRKRIVQSRFLQVLATYISHRRDSDYFTDPGRFVAHVHQLTESYRNPAAHISSMSKQSYEECKGALMGPGGALWQLIAATG